MATEADKELRLNILVTEEGNGVLHRVLSKIEHPKRRARHLLHLALTGLYAEAFLNASPAVLQKGVEPGAGLGEPLRPPVERSQTGTRRKPIASADAAAPASLAGGGNVRAGLDLVDVHDM